MDTQCKFLNVVYHNTPTLFKYLGLKNKFSENSHLKVLGSKYDLDI